MNRMLLLPVLALGVGLASIASGCSDDGTSSTTENASSSQSSATGTGSSSATGGEGGFSNPTGGGNGGEGGGTNPTGGGNNGAGGAGGEGGTAEPMCAGGTPGCGQCAADNCCKEATDCGLNKECVNGTICLYQCNEEFESCVTKCKPMQSNPQYDAYSACLVAKCKDVCP